MDAKRKDLKKLAEEGFIYLDPGLVDNLLDEAVDKYLKDFEDQERSNVQTAAIVTTIGTVTETFGVRGTTRLALDISNNHPILTRITKNTNTVATTVSLTKRTILTAIILGCSGLLVYDYLNKDEKEVA